MVDILELSLLPFGITMPPKKKSKSLASSSSSFDSSRFVSEEVEKIYNDVVVHKDCIPE